MFVFCACEVFWGGNAATIWIITTQFSFLNFSKVWIYKCGV